MGVHLGIGLLRQISTGAPLSHARRHPRAVLLAGAVALAAGAGLLVPGAASARREGRAGAEGRCALQLSAPAGDLTAGEALTLSGSLSCPTSEAAAEQTVTIYQRVAGIRGFSAIGTTTTETSGAYRFTIEALQTNSVFYVRADGARSGHVAVKLTPLVTIGGPPDDSTLAVAGRRAGTDASSAGGTLSNTVTFSGTVGPDAVGARVILQRESDTIAESWRRIAVGEVGASGEYSLTHTFFAPGAINVRVLVRAPGLLAGVSEPLSLQIAHPQNPRLTIQASPGPLSYGQSLTVSGTAAGAAHEPLTLFARTRQGAFTSVATVTTDAAGDYSFPTQSPLQSTIYRVRSARTSSVTLSEDVKPLLSAEVSATSVQAGEALTFSGTLAPAHAGQTVYLERKNPDGVGFHVVAVGALAADGSYSIAHTVSGAGTQAFCIKIASDGEDEAVASEPFEIQVARAGGDSLEPQGPGAGSTLAGES
jgi:hypothetical protein